MRRIQLEFDLFAEQDAANIARSTLILSLVLQLLVLANFLYLLLHRATPLLYASGVRYVREPPGEEHWQTFPALYRSGRGDCEDLAAARVAELWMLGERGARIDTQWRFDARGDRLYHVFVRRADGSPEDPSRLLGMGTHAPFRRTT